MGVCVRSFVCGCLLEVAFSAALTGSHIYRGCFLTDADERERFFHVYTKCVIKCDDECLVQVMRRICILGKYKINHSSAMQQIGELS